MAVKKKKVAPRRRSGVRKTLKQRAKKPKRAGVLKRVGRVKSKSVIRRVAGKDSVGAVTHYFPKVRAAVVKLVKPLAVGDTVRIKGHTTDFKQRVVSMQIDHVRVERAPKGSEIGLGVTSRVREHDAVTLV